jgi:hypothetical protein
MATLASTVLSAPPYSTSRRGGGRRTGGGSGEEWRGRRRKSFNSCRRINEVGTSASASSSSAASSASPVPVPVPDASSVLASSSVAGPTSSSASSSATSSSASTSRQHRPHRDLTREEINDLTSTTLSLDELCAAAAAVRARGPNPTLVTFSPKVFVPLTRACRDACGYCTFAADPTTTEDGEGGRGSRVYMSVEEVVAVAEAGRRAGATECLFTLGDRPEARYPVAVGLYKLNSIDPELESA